MSEQKHSKQWVAKCNPFDSYARLFEFYVTDSVLYLVYRAELFSVLGYSHLREIISSSSFKLRIIPGHLFTREIVCFMEDGEVPIDYSFSFFHDGLTRYIYYMYRFCSDLKMFNDIFTSEHHQMAPFLSKGIFPLILKNSPVPKISLPRSAAYFIVDIPYLFYDSNEKGKNKVKSMFYRVRVPFSRGYKFLCLYRIQDHCRENQSVRINEEIALSFDCYKRKRIITGLTQRDRDEELKAVVDVDDLHLLLPGYKTDMWSPAPSRESLLHVHHSFSAYSIYRKSLSLTFLLGIFSGLPKEQ
jgi:hypothetical protein